MTLKHHTTEAGHALAYQQQPGEGVGVVFLCGYRSDMEASKATALAEWAAKENVPFTRFDYFGHGKSQGEFIDYRIGRGLEDTLEILDHVATGEQILVGSSMGGWIGLIVARERRGQVRGFIGVAAAPDFTERMMYERFSPEQRATIQNDGVIWLHSDFYNNDYPVPLGVIEDGANHLLLDHPIPLEIPVHLLQGQMDEDVPWELALKIAERITGDEVAVTLVKDGDHRLSRPQDIAVLIETVKRLRGD